MTVTVSVKEISEQLNFEVLEEAGSVVEFSTDEINRPGLQLAGYYEQFAKDRVQVFGGAELQYLSDIPKGVFEQRMENFLCQNIPCIVCTRDMLPPAELLDFAVRYGIPVFKTPLIPDAASHEISKYIRHKMAPKILIHGVLVDLFGIGMLLRGESGMGKSEIALELIHSGHRLVADDVVEVRKVGGRLIGRAPHPTQYLLEVRGIGIVDVRCLYGVGVVIQEKNIELIVDLEYIETYNRREIRDSEEQYAEILGTNVRSTVLPVSPGRNIAVLIEVLARNYRLRGIDRSPASQLRFK